MSVTLNPPPKDVFDMSVSAPAPPMVKPRIPSVPVPNAYKNVPVVSNVSSRGSNSGTKLRGEPDPDSDPSGLIVKNEMLDVFAVYMKVPEGYVAFVEELPGANTQGETLEEARANLEEAVTMVLEANRELSEQSLAGAEVIRETLILPAA